MKFKLPAAEGGFNLQRSEQRCWRYTTGIVLLPVAVVLLAMGGIHPGTVDSQFYAKYRDLAVIDAVDDTTPSTLAFLNPPTVGAAYGGAPPTAEDTGKDVTFWVPQLLNYEQHIKGDKPIVLNSGPFVYRRYRQLYDAEFTGPEQDHLRYKIREFYIFDASKSSTLFNPNDLVIAPNVNWQRLSDELAVMYPEARDMEDILIAWFSSTIFYRVLVEAQGQYRKRWFLDATVDLMRAVLRDQYDNNINDVSNDWREGIARAPLVQLDLQYINPETDLIHRTVARAFWSGSQVSLRHEVGNALILGAIQERVSENLDGWVGDEYQLYRNAFQAAFPSIYRISNDPKATIAVQLILNWTMLFIVGDAESPHTRYFNQYMVDAYEELGVIPQNSGFLFSDIVGAGMGGNAALGIFEKLKSDRERLLELAELQRFIDNYNSTGNLTVPLEDALPPQRVFNDPSHFFGESLNNSCPPGASVFDDGTVRDRLIIGRPEFSCFTTGPTAPEDSYRSKIEASAMARLFRQFTCCGALFSSVLPTFYPNRAPTALRHQGSLQTLHFLLDAEEVLSRPEVAEPLARLGPELRRLQDLYLAETPLTTNATLRQADYEAFLDSADVVAMNDVCRDAMEAGGWGNFECFQVKDLVSWMEHIATEWYWQPELVKRSLDGNNVNDVFLNAGPFLRRTPANIIFGDTRDTLFEQYTTSAEHPDGLNTAPLFRSRTNALGFANNILPTLEYEFEYNTGKSNPRLINSMSTYKGLPELTTWETTSAVEGSFDIERFGAWLKYHALPPVPSFLQVFSFDMLRPMNFTKDAEFFGSDYPHQARYSWKSRNVSAAFERFPSDDRMAAPDCMVSLANLQHGIDMLFGKPWGTNCDNDTLNLIPERFPPGAPAPTEENYGSWLQMELLTGITTAGVQRKAWYYRYGGSRWYNATTTIYPMIVTEEHFGDDSFLSDVETDVITTRFLVLRFYPHLFFLLGCLVMLCAGCCFAWGMRLNGLPYQRGIQNQKEFYVPPEKRIDTRLQRKKDDSGAVV